MFGSHELGQTDVVWNDLNPVFEKTFSHTVDATKGCLDFRSADFVFGKEMLATFILFDKDVLSSDDHLGWVRLK